MPNFVVIGDEVIEDECYDGDFYVKIGDEHHYVHLEIVNDGFSVLIIHQDNDSFAILPFGYDSDDHVVADDADIRQLLSTNRSDKPEEHNRLILSLCKRIKQLKNNIDACIKTSLINF